MPFTDPPVLTVAIAVLLLLHTPALVASVRVQDEPLISTLVPEIAATVGSGFTITATAVNMDEVHPPLVTAT
jgi:hypothetical protein